MTALAEAHQRIEGLKDQMQEIARSDADHVKWHREAEGALEEAQAEVTRLTALLEIGSDAWKHAEAALVKERAGALAIVSDVRRRYSGDTAGCADATLALDEVSRRLRRGAKA